MRSMLVSSLAGRLRIKRTRRSSKTSFRDIVSSGDDPLGNTPRFSGSGVAAILSTRPGGSDQKLCLGNGDDGDDRPISAP